MTRDRRGMLPGKPQEPQNGESQEIEDIGGSTEEYAAKQKTGSTNADIEFFVKGSHARVAFGFALGVRDEHADA